MARVGSALPDPLAVRALPDYDPATPVFDMAGVVALCRALGVPVVTERGVRGAAASGRLRCYKVLRRNLYAEADVRAWLHSAPVQAAGQ